MKILIPTEYCILSEFAADLAHKICPTDDLEIHFVHVVNIPSEDETFEGKDFSAFLAGKNDEMKSWANKFEAQGHVLTGGMTDEIIQFSQDGQFDLVLLGNESRTGWQKVLSPNENTVLARKGHIPVMSLMCARSDLNVKDIVLFHDVYEEINVNLDVLKGVQEYCGAQLHLVYVDTGISKNHQESLESFVDQHQLKNTTIHVFPSDQLEGGIVSFLQEKHMDLVAIGVHPQRTLKSRILGSLVEHLHNHLHKPMLTLKLEVE